MAVLITGVTGFLGSHIAEKICETGETVIGLKRANSDLARIKNLANKIILYTVDSTNISKIFFEHKIDFVIHAATSYGDINKKNEIIASNFDLPKLLLDQCVLQNNAIKFINISTFFCKKVDIFSLELPEKHSTYTYTKKLFEYYGLIKSTNECISFLDIKLEHIYGPYDNVNNKFIPRMIKGMLTNQSEIKLTNCLQKRDFVYVKDVVDCIHKIYLKKNEIKKGFSQIEIGTGNSITVKEVLEKIKLLTKSNTILQYNSLDLCKYEVLDSFANLELLHWLDWTPQYTLENGLINTIQQISTLIKIKS